jgi:hypothetical protein
VLTKSLLDWWPARLSVRVRRALDQHHDHVASTSEPLDCDLAGNVLAKIDQLMVRWAAVIVERDSLPHNAHVLNGWGDICLKGRKISDRWNDFVHRDPSGGPSILQSDPEGEFHPWQSFAYAIMAGVDPDAALDETTHTLRTLSYHSRRLNTDSPHELGHLLFALAHLDPEGLGPDFVLNGRTHTPVDLFRLALACHRRGSFLVCRKFHLTEGLCAMSSRVPSMLSYIRETQEYLSQQMETLLALDFILHRLATTRKTDAQLVEELRAKLILGRFLENHLFYAGHAIELAAFATIDGFVIDDLYIACMKRVFNRLNAILLDLLPALEFEECFLHLGHYRRALTLFQLLDALSSKVCSTQMLTLYMLSIPNNGIVAEASVSKPLESERRDFPPGFDVVHATKFRNQDFEKIVATYNREAPPGLTARGGFSHFRRICPPMWPRAIHYEFLDYGEQVGIELHLEKDSVFAIAPLLQSMAVRLAHHFPEARVDWDPVWYKGRGRLRIIQEKRRLEAASASMQRLIELTQPKLDSPARACSELETCASQFHAH